MLDEIPLSLDVPLPAPPNLPRTPREFPALDWQAAISNKEDAINRREFVSVSGAAAGLATAAARYSRGGLAALKAFSGAWAKALLGEGRFQPMLKAVAEAISVPAWLEPFSS